MKKHNLFKVVGIAIIVAVLLTWIFPLTYYGYEFTEEARNQVGIFELFTFGPIIFNYFGNVLFYLFAVAGLYGVLHSIDGYRNLLDRIVKGFKNRTWLFLTIVMVLFAVMTSMAGLTVALLLLFPFVISIILLMGYNKQTAALTTIGSVAVGLIGTTVSASNINVVVSVLDLKFGSELLTKVILLLVGLVLLVYNVLSYAAKHKTEKIEESVLIPTSKDSKKKGWSIVIVLDLMLIVMILASLSWDTVFGVEAFNKFNEAVVGFKVFGFPLFGKLLSEGTTVAFGKWTLLHLTCVVVFGTILLGIINRKKFNDFVESYFNGVKQALVPGLLIFLAYIVLVVTATHPVLLAIYKPILTLTKGFNTLTMSLVAFISSVFNIEPYYIASSFLPYVTSLSGIKSSTYPLVAVITQSMQGLATLIAPTSVVLLATLSYLGISFGNWVKTSWKFILEILAALLIIFTILLWI